MPTFNQLSSVSKIRKKKYKRNKVLTLRKCPQKRGQCLKIFIKAPKMNF